MAMTAAGSALVAANHKETDMSTRTVRVVRGFLYQGKPIKAGVEMELSDVFAREMRAAGKVEFIEAAPAEKSSTAKNEKKESSHAK